MDSGVNLQSELGLAKRKGDKKRNWEGNEEDNLCGREEVPR